MKPGNANSPENDPVLLPPDSGGQDGGEGRRGSEIIVVVVGLALLIFLAILVIWVLPDLGQKTSSEETMQSASQPGVELAVNVPAGGQNTGNDDQQFETAMAIDHENNEVSKEVQQIVAPDEILIVVQQGDDKEKEVDLDEGGEQDFQQAVGRALVALAEGKFEAARSALQEAKVIRPDDAVLVDLSGQISRKELSAELSRLREKSVVVERQEKWQEAVDVCRQALSLSPTAAFAVACQDRAQSRLDLDKRLQVILAQPERLFDKGPLQEAKEILTFVMIIFPPGPRLAGQVKQLSTLIDQAETEVTVLLQSDDLTDIVIYHVGRLGRFAEKSLVLPTGNYTVVGSRQGFRDVRQTLKVRPGSGLVFTVRCEEPI